MAFFMKNEAPLGVVVELSSTDRNTVWPGDDQVYFLEMGEKKSVPIKCQAGENICYGAWLNGDAGTFWGVGPDRDQLCEDCCTICVEKATTTIVIGR
jgi:hypothetical protein